MGRAAHELDASGGTMCAHTEALAQVVPANDIDHRRLTVTTATIAESMINYPALPNFPAIEEAGWRTINAALQGEMQPPSGRPTHPIDCRANFLQDELTCGI